MKFACSLKKFRMLCCAQVTSVALFCSFFFAFLATLWLIVNIYNKPRILVLHSYSSKYKWVKHLNMGLDSIFQRAPYLNVKKRYLNIKAQTSPRVQKQLERTTFNFMSHWKPDVTIAMDLKAQELLANYGIRHPKIKIVFAGITNEEYQSFYKKITHVSGILEMPALEGTKEVLEKLFPKRRKLFYLSDCSKTGVSLIETFKHFDWSPFQLVFAHCTNHFEKWQENIEQLNKQEGILLLPTYHTVRLENKHLQSKKVVRWTLKTSRHPVIGFYQFFIKDGGNMAIAISGFEHGEAAAKLALGMLEHPPVRQILQSPKDHFSFLLNQKKFSKKFPEVKIPLFYRAFAEWSDNDLTM